MSTNPHAGKFVVIEGTDGSGKSEQAKRLIARLESRGELVLPLDFPRYDKPSAYFVREYLNGAYGGPKDVSAKGASLFYALDRFGAAKDIRTALDEGIFVVSNRYVGSNMGHQGGKIEDENERKKFFEWLYDLEYRILAIPRPDLNIILHVPAEISQQLVDKKGARTYVGGVRRDIHEADITHLRNAERAYRGMAQLFPDEFTLIECVEEGNLLSIEAVHERVWKTVQKLLSI